jgi:hypothetical protein
MSVGISRVRILRTNLRLIRVRRFEDVPQECLGLLLHYSAREGISLIRPKIMALIPAAACQLSKVGARVELFVVRVEVVQYL